MGVYQLTQVLLYNGCKVVAVIVVVVFSIQSIQSNPLKSNPHWDLIMSIHLSMFYTLHCV